jgi:hypothetical protein
VSGEVPGSGAWFLIAKRSHLLAPQVAELKTHAAECVNLWWIDYFIFPTLGILGNLVHFKHFNLPSACVCGNKINQSRATPKPNKPNESDKPNQPAKKDPRRRR